ncbi:glycosyltransferase involved in cell wall bisynthesis [Hoeflea halophila]|uniref:Glycosyltransferase involved in cell wall bisynthesis n=2 Tax=Hoeflea halophila TaxID=714899 RepID=A0A286ICP6_9HYPH|nr:glycosyltransferase involved in cell wall bisynthesis [Hoeflea halophila]
MDAAAPAGDKLDILIVSQYFWPEDIRLNELAIGLAERGHNITVLTGLPNYPTGKIFPTHGWRGPWTETYQGVRVIRAPLIPRGRKSKIGLVLNYFSFALTASVLALFRAARRYDAVFVYEISPVTVGFPGMVAAWKAEAPMFLWVLDLWPESLSASGMMNSPLANKVASWLARRVYAGSDVILATSQGFESSICRVAGKKREVRWFPQWEDLRKDAAPIGDTRLPALPQGFKVVFTGNVGASQDFETVVGAAELLKDREDIQFVIVGDGHKLDWVREQSAKRGLSETFHCLGRFPSTTMPAFYRQADALLISLRDEPAFAVTVPAKLQSYLAAGKPIVSCVSGEVKKIVTDSGAGIGVDAGSPEALASAIAELAARNPAERGEMGRRGRAYMEKHYNMDTLFDQLVEWFRAEKRAP